MGFQYLKITSLEQALEMYLKEINNAGITHQIEEIPVVEAMNRITSKAVYAKLCSPHYNSCAMDGIALRADVTFGATETSPVVLKKADVTYVDTGDPLPDGCDCVIMIEDVIEVDDDIVLYHTATPWQHIRQIGEDMSVGDMILTSFTKITPVAMGAMLACGVFLVEVLKKPTIGIIPTGDEIVEPTKNPEKGKIIEFNSTIFSGMACDCGANAKVYPIVKDQKEELIHMLNKAVEECDVVILNAGSSAGRDDYSCEVISRVGKLILHGIAMKPGKPTVLGISGKVPIIGMPGYPVAGIIVFQNIVEPILRYFMGIEKNTEEILDAYLTKNYNSSLSYREYVRVRLGHINGQIVATPINHGAGIVSSFLKADGIVEFSQNSEGGERGKKIPVRLLKSPNEFLEKLVVMGSHDPLIDEISDIMIRKKQRYGVISSHVGSMGAIMAIKNGEAHLGAIHLFDEETGIYNIPFVKKYFSKSEVKIVEGVCRIQGLMVQKGNPKGIKDIRDIQRQDIAYVNRQKGSGTRVLMDYFVKRKGIKKENIRGYDREELTHTNVAAIIAGGSADVGMGIQSVANIYGLDFIPICEEHYDFLVNEKAMNSKIFQEFLLVIRGEEFKKRLEKIGGYIVKNIGDIIDF